MSRKTWKAFALVAGGGIIMQLSGCGIAIAQLLVQNVISSLISALVSGVNDATTAA